MKTSKIFLLISLLVLATMLFVACGGGASETAAPAAEEAAPAEEGAAPAEEAAAPAEEAEPVTLRVLIHQNPPMVEFMEAFNDEFEAAYPNVTVDMSIVETGDLPTVTQTRLTANDVDVIDIFGFANAAQPYMTDVDPPNWQQFIRGRPFDGPDRSAVC